jgi:soluble lytic murein transglycosylase-like protein
MKVLLVRSVIKREFNLNPEAVSNKVAVGLMQVMPKMA